MRAHRHGAAHRHRVEGVEDQIGERVTYLALNSRHLWQIVGQLGRHLDGDALPLSQIAPSGVREGYRLLDYFVEPEGGRRAAPVVRPGEFPHSRYGLRHPVHGVPDLLQELAGACVQVGLLRQQHFGVERDW